MARRSNVNIAVSNPCFELWLALHFSDQTGPISTAKAIRLRRTVDGSQDKGVYGSLYMPLRAAAVRRAMSLEQRHKGNGTSFPSDNPSSGMYRLVQAIQPVGLSNTT